MQNRQDILDNLILSCTEEIEYKDTNATSKNKTKCPVLFMYMGDYAVDNYELVKNVIDKNWRLNARYIYHIGMKSDDGKLYNLVDGSVLNDKTDDESVVLDEVFSEILMAPTGTFNEHNVIKIKFITSAADAGVEKYINTALGIKTTLTGLNLFKDMFVLLAQGGSHQERSATDVALKMLHEKEKNGQLTGFRQIYVLSNRMKNGAILDSYNMRTSFRLVADVTLLIDNDDEKYDDRKSKFYSSPGALRTVSHRIVEKPCREIVVSMLKALLQLVREIPKNEKDHIFRMFENEKFEENYFEEHFENKLPTEENFKYLPYTEEGLKELTAIYKGNKGMVDEASLEKATYGCFPEFYALNYIDAVKKSFNEKDFCEQLTENFIEKYSYRDIIEYFRFEELVEEACKSQNIQIDNFYAKTMYTAMARYCYLKAQNAYFDMMRPSYKDTMTKLHSAAKVFEKLVVEMQDDISSVCVIENIGMFQSIEQYYSDYMGDYFRQHRDDILDCININVNDFEKLSESLIKIFKKILSADVKNLLLCAFTEELRNRLGATSTPEHRNKLIQDALVPKIDEFTRMNVAIDTIAETYDAYLCDEKSEFLNEINASVRFNTNDSNCFEHLKIYTFESIRDILGGRMEEIQ